MHRLTLLAILVAAAAFAQDAADVFNKPPAGVDETLRKRINEFYDYHVKKEFRKAEPLVAEDTKDFFYAANKPAFLGCEINKITYSEKFTRAKALMLCEQYIMAPGFYDKPMKMPFASNWKLVDGQWYWYVDVAALKNTPFGVMKPGTGPPPLRTGPAAPSGGSPFGPLPDNGDFVMRFVKADKDTVSLKPGETATVTISNGAPGIMDISLTDSVPGVEAKLDHTSLKVDDKAVLALKAGNDAQSGVLTVKVEQTSQTIEIQVNVK